MTTRPRIPYYAPPESLPASLPTVEEILASEDRFPVFGARTIVRVNKHFLVKYGTNVSLQEGENMLFVRQSSDVAVPTLYALFHDSKTRNNFIVQEFVCGQNLRACYYKLSEHERAAVWAQLRRNVDALRAIPSPGYFGGVWGQPCQDAFLTGSRLHDFPPHPGPIRTEREWVAAMVETGNRVNRLPPEYGAFIADAYETVFRGHEAVFTHGDLDPNNVLVRDDDKAVVLIDWEMAGWAPSFWEYCTVQSESSFENVWEKSTHLFLDKYTAEYGWFMNYRLWLGWQGAGRVWPCRRCSLAKFKGGPPSD